MNDYAEDFEGIPAALANNAELRAHTLALVDAEPIHGKALEGTERLTFFRGVLSELVNGRYTLSLAIQRVNTLMGPSQSPHAGNARVFPAGWAERLIRVQFSRFYNQAVLELILARGGQKCFVPHSRSEAPDSPCSIHLAGASHDAESLYQALIAAYRDGNYSAELKVPHHPHCTHVVKPVP